MHCALEFVLSHEVVSWIERKRAEGNSSLVSVLFSEGRISRAVGGSVPWKPQEERKSRGSRRRGKQQETREQHVRFRNEGEEEG